MHYEDFFAALADAVAERENEVGEAVDTARTLAAQVGSRVGLHPAEAERMEDWAAYLAEQAFAHNSRRDESHV